MRDHNDSSTFLWDAKILSVKHSVRGTVGVWDASEDSDFSPSVFWNLDVLAGEEAQKVCEVLSAVTRQDSGDVFPYDPSWFLDSSNSQKLDCQVATRIIQSASESCGGEALTWGSADEEVDLSVIEDILFLQFRHVAEVGRIGVSYG